MANFELSMREKVCLITGGTSGIGEATAYAVAKKGATTVVVGRNPEKSAGVVEKIKLQTINPNVSFLLADLSSQAQIHQLAEQFKRQHSRLDVLVNNAGGAFFERQLSADGIEMTFALNHLSGFLLTALLLDTLKASTPSRIINISSATHKAAHMDENDWQTQKKYSGMEAYHRSKLANLLFTYELARQLEGTGVTANAVKPGFTKTGLGQNNKWSPVLLLLRLMTAIAAQSAEKGAETAIYLATSPEVTTVSGKYFDKQVAILSSKESYNAAAAKHLWQLGEALVRLA
jgi:NAD(P)-dependent dehydrogenase (short-subunit alcohol dehydrogenase family)